MYRRLGLSAYPTDPYYDPDRPAWLPYWIDDPTESAQKYAMYPGANVNTVYPNPPSPVPAVVQPDLTGQTVDINSQIAQTQAANQTQTQSFFNQLAALLPNSPTAPQTPNAISWLYLGAAVVALIFVSNLVGGRR